MRRGSTRGATTSASGRHAPSAWSCTCSAATSGSCPWSAAAHGYFARRRVEATPGTRYRYRLDGGDELPDPASRWQPDGVHGPSAVVDPTAFPWTDELFQAPPLPELVLYELHVGTFTAEGTFDAAIERLDDLVELGVTAFEIMPVAQFPGRATGATTASTSGRRSRPTAGPTACGGSSTPATRAASPSSSTSSTTTSGPRATTSSGSPRTSPTATTRRGVRRSTSTDRGSDEVRRFFCGNALHWLDEYHVDALRLDAVHGIVDTSAVPFLARAAGGRRAARRAPAPAAHPDRRERSERRARDAPGRGGRPRARLGLERRPAPRRCTPRSPASATATTSTSARSATSPRRSARASSTTGASRRSAGDATARRPWASMGATSSSLARTTTRSATGRSASGCRRSCGFETVKLVAGIVLLAPFVPLLFMGEEYGETAPFLYFTDHADAELNEARARGSGAASSRRSRVPGACPTRRIPTRSRARASTGACGSKAGTGSCSTCTASCCDCAARLPRSPACRCATRT